MEMVGGPSAAGQGAAFHIEEVRWVCHWNDHMFSFALSRPASLRFRSGEFVMLGLRNGARPLLRAYSIASPAYADELEFLSIKVPDGPLTGRLQKIRPGDEVHLSRKATGTLVVDALRPGRRLVLLGTGTGLAPFLSVIRDPHSYERFDHVVLMHSVRRESDLAYRDLLETHLSDDPLVGEEARDRFVYLPVVTREPFPRSRRISAMLEDPGAWTGEGLLPLDPAHDRIMLCGSMSMIADCTTALERLGFREGANSSPADYVIEKAFVG